MNKGESYLSTIPPAPASRSAAAVANLSLLRASIATPASKRPCHPWPAARRIVHAPAAWFAKTFSIPPKQFYGVASASSKYKHMPGERLLMENRLHLRTQSRKASPHIGHTSHNPDLGARAQLDHLPKLSRIACNTDRSAPRSTLTVARPGSSMWIAPLDAAGSWPTISCRSLRTSELATAITTGNSDDDRSPASTSRPSR